MMSKQGRKQTKHDDLVDLARELDLEVGPHIRTRNKRKDGVLMEEQLGYITFEGAAEIAKALGISPKFGATRQDIFEMVAEEIGYDSDDPLRGGCRDARADFIKQIRKEICD